MSESQLTKNQVISVLTKSPHGDLKEYVEVAVPAAQQDPEFYSHLIAWNAQRGQIRDAKAALPVLALTSPGIVKDEELRENAQAHLLSLDPRTMVRAVRFALSQPLSHEGLKTLIARYLADREASPKRFERVALLHRHSLHELYALLRINPGPYAQQCLGFYKDREKKVRWPKVGLFAEVARLKDMSPVEAAGSIVRNRIPFLIAAGALGVKAKDPDVVQALIEAMTPSELVTNSKLLDKLGVKTNPALRATYEAALGKAEKSKKVTLKTTKAAEAVGGVVGEKLKALQQKQLAQLGVKGDWLVIADKSGSMQVAIEAARHIAGTLCAVAQGSVYLVFVDTHPTFHNMTGKTLEQITELTKRVTAGGGTCIGCGVSILQEKKLTVDGICVVSDGGENGAPMFAPAYEAYCKKMDCAPSVYFYQVQGTDHDVLSGHCRSAGVEVHTFDLRKGVDYYSLPNLVQTMRVNRYDLTEEIMATPLLKLRDVLRGDGAVVREEEVAL